MGKQPKKLFNSVLTIHIVTGTMLILLLLAVLITIQYRYLNQQMIRNGIQAADYIAIAAVDPTVQTLAYDRIAPTIEKLLTNAPQLKSIVVYNSIGGVVKAGGLTAGKDLTVEELKGLLPKISSQDIYLTSSKIPKIYAALSNTTETIGIVRVELATAYMRTRIIKTILLLSGLGLVLFSVLILVDFIFINQKLGIPLAATTAMMQRYGKHPDITVVNQIKESLTTEPNDEIGQMMHTFANLIDTIETQNAELRKSEELYRSYIDNAPMGILIADKSGRYLSANNTICQMTGYSEAEMLKLSIPDIVAPESLEVSKQHFNRVVATGHASGELLYLPKNGKKRHWSVDAVKLSEDRYLSFHKDITKERELEAQLHHSQKMDAVGQLAGGIAHDFNNLLAGIMNAAQLLKSPKRNLDKKERKFADIILQSAERAADLTKKLSTFSRKENIAAKAINVHEIINEVEIILSNTINKNISIKMDIKADHAIIIGDSSGLQSALLNLGINASQAMPEGGELSIRTDNRTFNQEYCTDSQFDLNPGTYLEIEISDTGCGISPQDLLKIYDPFFTTKEPGKGTGLGLAAVYGMIINHHGAINVTSEVGRGTSFTIRLPCSDIKTKPYEPTTEVISGSGLILLVDDEESIRISGAQMLQDMGYQVLLAEDGKEAIKLFAQRKSEIDLVVMDMIMPQMNGSAAFYQMKETDPQCKVIISSGFTRDENLDSLMAAGLCGFIQKPFRDFELSRLLAEALNKPA